MPARACSICSPQPDHVGFAHRLHITSEHMAIPYIPVSRSEVNMVKRLIDAILQPSGLMNTLEKLLSLWVLRVVQYLLGTTPLENIS